MAKVREDNQEWRMGVVEKNKLRMKDNSENKLKIKQDNLIKKMKVLNKHETKEKSIMDMKSNWDSTLRNNR